MGVRGDDKLNDIEAGVGVGMEEGLADAGRVCPSEEGPLYNEPILEKR